MKEDIQILIEESENIITKKKWREETYPEINLIEILRNISDEVNVHSQIIYSLIYPKNKLHIGFADQLFRLLGLDLIRGQQYQVSKEYRNIDLLIRTKELAIIIENKIHAADQEGQLCRYYQEMLKSYKKEQIRIVFLSLDGKEPSAKSLGDLNIEDICLLSYEQDIIRWIDRCVAIAAEYPSYRESLIQYKKIIQKLTGRSEFLTLEKVGELIKSSTGKIEAAKAIAEAYEVVKADIQLDFWVSLEKELSSRFGNRYEIIDIQRYSDNAVRKYYTHSKNNKYYGIMFKVDGIDVGKDRTICAYIEIDWNVYWGLLVVNKSGEKYTKENNHRQYFGNLITQFDQTFPVEGNEFLLENNLSTFGGDQWIGGFEFKDQRFDFRNFSNETITKMIEGDHKKNTIEKLANTIERSIRLFSKS